MALIGKIRQKTGLLLGFIGIAMLIFLVQEALSSNNLMGGSSSSLGKINGNKVEATTFFNEAQNYEDKLKTINPNIDINDQTNLYIREEVWNNFAVKDILGKTFKDLGLTVTNSEVTEAFKGNELHPLVVNVLGQAFMNPQTGEFDRSKMIETLNNMDNLDPSFKKVIIDLEYFVEQDRERTKYASLVSKSAYIPTFIAKEELANIYKTANAEILSIPYTSVDDEPVSDKEIQEYIKKRPIKYKRDENVSLDMVIFDLKPSEQDKIDIDNRLISIKEELKSIDDDSLYIARSSIQGGNIIYQNYTQLLQNGRTQVDSIMTQPVGSFIGPYEENGSVVLSYIADRRPVPDSVRASIIFLSYTNADDIQTKKELSEKIISDVQNGVSSFAQNVIQYSEDETTKANSGDMGFLPQGVLDLDLNRKLFYEMPIGGIETAETQNGLIIVQKTDYMGLQMATRVVDFAEEFAASDETAKNIYGEANQFWQDSKTIEEFDNNAKTKKALKNLIATPKDINLSGIEGTRSVIQWAFKDGKAGEITFIDLSDKYVVVKLNSKNKAGLASVSEVKNEVGEAIQNDKKASKIIGVLKNSKGSLSDIANSNKGNYDENVSLQYSSDFIDAIGNEPAVVGATFATKEGQQSKPVKGEYGVYIVKPISIQDLAGSSTLSTTDYKKQKFSQGSQMLNFETIFGTILENSKVDDKRYMMY